jgi:hypothetical protein
MKKTSPLSVICTVIFLIGIIAAFLGNINTGNMIMIWTLMIVSVIYLFSGWYIFKGYHPDGHPILLFLMGYLYSAIFMAFAFVTAGWPMAKTFIVIAPVWAIIQIAMVTVIRKKLSRGNFIQFLIEGGIMIILSIVAIIK